MHHSTELFGIILPFTDLQDARLYSCMREVGFHGTDLCSSCVDGSAGVMKAL
jgi:hypothetical protein